MEPASESAKDSERSFAFYTTLLITSILPVGLLVCQRNFRAIAGDYEVELSGLVYWLLQPAAIASLGILPVVVFVKEYVISKVSYRSWFNLVALNVGIFEIVMAAYGFVSTIFGEEHVTP